jgi:hypothetical protein
MMRKLMARKHIHAPPHWDVETTVSHNDDESASYFLRTMQMLLLSLGYSEPLLFIKTPRLLQGNTYLWHVLVVLYERSTADRICCIRQVIEAAALRWTF